MLGVRHRSESGRELQVIKRGSKWDVEKAGHLKEDETSFEMLSFNSCRDKRVARAWGDLM